MSERFSILYFWYLQAHFRLKVFLFEHWFWLYERLFGFLRVFFDKESRLLIEQHSHPNLQ